MRYFDAHLHPVPDALFEEAFHAGVDTFFCNATSPKDWQTVLDVPRRHLGVWCCLGVHPWYIDELPMDWADKLSLLLERNPLAMVGEIGLDFHRPNYDKQKRVFMKQLELARRYHRSVHIHCVGAWPDMIQIMSQYPDLSMLFHRFSGDEVVVQKLRFLDAYISVINGKCIGVIPDNRLLVESDAPDGLKSPAVIPALVEKLRLDANYLYMNLERFLDGK